MKKNLFIMLLISSLISLSGFGQEKSFTFKSDTTKFELGNSTISNGEIKMISSSGAISTIVKNTEYTISANTEYTVKGNFTELDVSENQLTSLNVSDLTNLERLICSNNRLQSIDVSALIELKIINCSNNPLTSLGISGLTKLKYLNYSNSKLPNLNVSSLINLTELNCENNNIQNLNITALKKLKGLNCSNNKIKNIDISKFKDLEIFNCCKNKLQTLDVSTAKKLKYLNYSSTGLKTLNVSGLTDLEELYCGYNNIASLNISSLTKLKVLSCAKNELENIDLSPFKDLEIINCSDNKFKNLDFSALKKLERLKCSNNILENLNLTGLKKIKYLDYSNTSLSNLNISNLTDLEELYCINNNIQKLNISALKKLKGINCSNNQVQNIDLSGFKNLEKINCSRNKLQSLNLSGLKNLKKIWCENNLFEVCALDKIFSSLAFKEAADTSQIFILRQNTLDGIYKECRTYIANEKNWNVYYIKSADDGTSEEIEILNSEPYGCPEEEKQSFTFTSSETKFKIGNSTDYSGNIKIKPGIGGEAESTIVKSKLYTIKKDEKYTVTGSFTQLNVSTNKLTSLDVSNLTNLNKLWCVDNQLEVLNVSNLKNLSLLSCFSNELTSLNLSGLTNLTYISCYNNKLNHCAVDELFKSLASQTSNLSGDGIYITHKDIASDLVKGCRVKIANDKNWKVLEYVGADVQPNVLTEIKPFVCPSSIPENLASELDIKVFPNPVRDALQIESAEVIKQVSVFDISGKLLIKELVNDVNFSLQTADLNRGMYVLRIQTAKDLKNIKLIKE